MENINSIVVTGNVTRDIGEKDFGYIGGDNGIAKLSISIAVNKNVKRNGEWTSEACFFDVEIWGKLAESMKKYLHKGKSIAVQGKLDQDRWEKDGQNKSRVYIRAENIQLLGGGKEKSESNVPATSENNNLGFKEDPVF